MTLRAEFEALPDASFSVGALDDRDILYQFSPVDTDDDCEVVRRWDIKTKSWLTSKRGEPGPKLGEPVRVIIRWQDPRGFAQRLVADLPDGYTDDDVEQAGELLMKSALADHERQTKRVAMWANAVVNVPTQTINIE